MSADYLPHPKHGQFDADMEPFLSRHDLLCPCMHPHTLEHRWSGWPGAWCLDCGIADPAEECLAAGCIFIDENSVILCKDHPVEPCRYPGSNLFNPYYAKTREGA